MIMRMMSKTMVAVAAALTLSAAGCTSAHDIIDGKAELSVPGGGTCYLLEIDREHGTEEMGESYACVSKAEWDANRVGEDWVDANGKRK